jgi:membrane protein YqaA with SNARE-associated domain
MLRSTYTWIMHFSGKPQAIWALVAVSFAESSFFPIPPDPLYMAMILARPQEAWRLAFICTLSSVVGGILGYYIGYALYESLGTWIIQTYSLQEAFDKFQLSFEKWGFWIVALKGLTPIPYKIVTIFSGVAKLEMSTFIGASILARGFRFYMVAGLLRYCGPTVRDFIERNLMAATALIFLAIIGGFFLIKYI